MFKPSYGKCIKCGNDRLIVVKRGLCRACNELGKGKNNSPKKQSDAEGGKRRMVSSLPRGSNLSTKVGDKSKGRKIKSNKSSNNARTIPTAKKRKPTGELELFKRIYEERGPYSQVAPYDYVDFDVRCFSHILSKGAYPSLRLDPANIIIKTPQQHDDWHNRYDRLKALPEWQWVFKLEQELKENYYKQNKIKKL